MNSACVPPPRAKQNFQSSAAARWVVVDRLIHGVGVDLSGAVAVDRCPDVAEQFGQLRLVVGADPFTRGAPFGIGGHDGDATVSGRGGRGQSSPVVPDAGADQPGGPEHPASQAGGVGIGADSLRERAAARPRAGGG